jgi:hypothetical protein
MTTLSVGAWVAEDIIGDAPGTLGKLGSPRLAPAHLCGRLHEGTSDNAPRKCPDSSVLARKQANTTGSLRQKSKHCGQLQHALYLLT